MYINLFHGHLQLFTSILTIGNLLCNFFPVFAVSCTSALDPCDAGLSCVELTDAGTSSCLCAIGQMCTGDCVGDVDTLSLGTQMCEGKVIVC